MHESIKGAICLFGMCVVSVIALQLTPMSKDWKDVLTLFLSMGGALSFICALIFMYHNGGSGES
jgi:hypothetical protein